MLAAWDLPILGMVLSICDSLALIYVTAYHSRMESLGMHMSLLYRSTVTVVVQQVVDFRCVKSVNNFKV